MYAWTTFLKIQVFNRRVEPEEASSARGCRRSKQATISQLTQSGVSPLLLDGEQRSLTV
jgi:hypothetical protein